MIAIVLLGLLTCAGAAPWHKHHQRHGSSHYEDGQNMDEYIDSLFEREMFNTQKFWSELSREMMALDAIFADLAKYFPYNDPSVQVDGKDYKVTLNLSGFDEKEVIVKAKKGLLVVQAVHKVDGEPERNYLIMRTLPNNVGENGSWTYENGVLTIIFPIAHDATEAPTQTAAPEHSREEMDNTGGNKDLTENIDEIRGDAESGNRNDLLTNEIPHRDNSVEATTYAVGLNDDVELLPMRRY